MLQEETVQAFCPYCKDTHAVMVLDQTVTLTLAKGSVQFDERTLLCERTYDDFITPDEVTRNLHRAVCAQASKTQDLEALQMFNAIGLVEVKDRLTDEIFLLEQAVWRHYRVNHQEHEIKATVAVI